MSCSIRSTQGQDHRQTVSVNGAAIAHDAISRETQNHPAPTPIDAWKAAARALAVRELLLQEARRLDLQPSPTNDAEGRHETNEEALIGTLIETQVPVPSPEEASCRRYYERNRSRFRSADLYEASHILIAARRSEPDAFTAARERATVLLAHLEAAPQAFSELAKTHSDCPSAASGGNLGQFTAGTTTPEFEKALLALEPGQVTSAPIETRYGFHIIRLERSIPGRQLPFDAVQDQIVTYLTERSRRLGIAQYVARLAAGARISGVDLPTPASLRTH
jgi:peptidyl-prolyl cis-trans isomerase C